MSCVFHSMYFTTLSYVTHSYGMSLRTMIWRPHSHQTDKTCFQPLPFILQPARISRGSTPTNHHYDHNHRLDRRLLPLPPLLLLLRSPFVPSIAPTASPMLSRPVEDDSTRDVFYKPFDRQARPHLVREVKEVTGPLNPPPLPLPHFSEAQMNTSRLTLNNLVLATTAPKHEQRSYVWSSNPLPEHAVNGSTAMAYKS